MTAMANPPNVESQLNIEKYSGFFGSATAVVVATNTMTTPYTNSTNALAPKGVPWRDTEARGRGARRSRASAKTPRDAETAQPINTAIMSMMTTSSTKRWMPTDAYPPAALGPARVNNGAPAF